MKTVCRLGVNWKSVGLKEYETLGVLSIFLDFSYSVGMRNVCKLFSDEESMTI